MLKKCILFFAPILLFSFGAPLSEFEADKPATIKVLLEKGIEGAVIEVKGPHKVFNPMDGRQIKSRFVGKRYYMQSLSNGIKWGSNFDRIHQIRIVPTKHDATIVVNGIEYRGCLDAYLIDEKLFLVNEVAIEDYLSSSLVGKFAETLHHEVVDALTIISRTNAYLLGWKGRNDYWNVDAKKVGYLGNGVAMLDKEVERAITGTRHLIMTYENRPFPAGWTENCAGRTASYSAIYRKKEKTPCGVKVPVAEKARNNSTWCFTLGKDELAKMVKTNRISQVDLYMDELSSKVYAMRVKDGDHTHDLDFFALQEALGHDRLISNDFTIRVDKNRILFEGYGRGTGVGLCLLSAQEFAHRNALAPKILSQFFPETQLEKVRTYEELNRPRSQRIIEE